ncbi:hypothetical protein [Mucilaginibacter psychrotolerans]|uniref:Uncharacterized protein n=1 Tax=Mucilaginibacter psychrotolerans TaxID=1524096 RepID=A0A4Y8S9F8_9SPHI|nr:hypothetical protein [Mucilaginibacter psychrotolerans]TFF35167.1 hypothetical protein E2R66_19580 [Mucilaginibacter psychrotolerans]
MGIAEDSVNISWKSVAKRMRMKLPAWMPKSIRVPMFVKVVFILALLGGVACYCGALIKIYPQKQSVGYFAGECYGTCEVNYIITADSLVVDRFNNVTRKKEHIVTKGDFRKLKFEVPLAMILHPKNFGCPDCSDGGALTLGFTYRGNTYSYALDSDYAPWYFKNMGDVIGDRIAKVDSIAPYKD